MEIKTTEVKEAIKEKVLEKKGVAGIGISKSSKQQIIIYVESLTSDIKSLPATIAGVSIKVVESGRFYTLQKTTRLRPAPGGCSIGHYEITAGTLGCVVRDLETGRRVILSNNHVLAMSNQAKIGHPIYQPGPFDGGTGADKIAELTRFVKILKPEEGDNLVDCAIATPLNDEDISNEIIDIGVVNEIEEASIGMEVAKSGRTTCYKESVVFDTNATVKIYGYPWGYSIFEDQIITRPGSEFSKGGDSGSLVINKNTKRAVGLLFAGSEYFTVINKITNVFRLLNIDFGITPRVRPISPLTLIAFPIASLILGRK